MTRTLFLRHVVLDPCYCKYFVTMRIFFFCFLFIFPVLCFAQKFSKPDIQRFKNEANAVTIVRDNWGVPHIYGNTDADAVFGLMYVECEDNFKGIEQNYLYQIGRQTEASGESNL